MLYRWNSDRSRYCCLLYTSLFLKSPFALIELGIIMIIMIIYQLLWDKFDKEEQAEKEKQETSESQRDEKILLP